MKKKIMMVALILSILNVTFLFALSATDLWVSLKNGLSASEAVANQSKNWANADQAEAGWDRFLSHLNKAESAVQDAENYVSVNETLPTPEYQRMVNQIKANLRQVRNKMNAFGISTSWAIDL